MSKDIRSKQDYDARSQDLCFLCEPSDASMPHAFGWCLKLLGGSDRGVRIMGPRRAADRVRQLLDNTACTVRECADCIAAVIPPGVDEDAAFAAASDVMDFADLCSSDPADAFFEAGAAIDAANLAYYEQAGLTSVADNYIAFMGSAASLN